jgi:hypothetical protein
MTIQEHDVEVISQIARAVVIDSERKRRWPSEPAIDYATAFTVTAYVLVAIGQYPLMPEFQSYMGLKRRDD